MLFVGVLFGALWLTALAQGRVLDEHVARVDEASTAHAPRSYASRY